MMMALASAQRSRCWCPAASHCAGTRRRCRPCKPSARGSLMEQIALDYAAEVGCRTCATPGGGCQFLGTAATAQVIGEALGLSLPHTALAPSGHADLARCGDRSAQSIAAAARTGLGNSRKSSSGSDPERNGVACCLWGIDESAAACSRHRLCMPDCSGPPPRIGRSQPPCRALWMHCPMDRETSPRFRFLLPAAFPK